jgi:UDP:flavonoid glycosyltransferase YjiC (YdhE family)
MISRSNGGSSRTGGCLAALSPAADDPGVEQFVVAEVVEDLDVGYALPELRHR